MITAVDTNIFLDVLIPRELHAESSERALTEALSAGPVVIAEAVYAELAVHFPVLGELDRFLGDNGVQLLSSGAEALHLAGTTWREYLRRRTGSWACPSCGASQDVHCPRCGTRIQSRQHLMGDFLIGAHAHVHADRLLTRDRGYYRTYFPDLSFV